MMHIAVTGGSGHTGRAVVKHLILHGYNVRIIDKNPPIENDIPYTLCDLQEFGQAIGCLGGCEAVVHLAAIPRPIYHPSHIVFRTNVIATYNVFEAAAVLGIRRVIYASSISVTGYPFYERFFEPKYLPIDEDHPSAPQDAYAISKHLGEEIAKAFVRRTGMTAISLRLPWVHTPETFRSDISPHHEDPLFGASNLWSYVDVRDAAQAFQLSLESAPGGYDNFYISAPDTFMEVDSVDLAKDFYPHSAIRPTLSGNISLISSDKASQYLGYKASFTWRSYDK